MKKIIMCAVLTAISVTVYAASNRGGSLVTTDPGLTSIGTPIQAMAVNGKYGAIQTGASVTIDMRNDSGWNMYSPSVACKFRAMTSATKAGIQYTIPLGQDYSRVVHPESAFINFSGCTSGELQRMKFTR